MEIHAATVIGDAQQRIMAELDAFGPSHRALFFGGFNATRRQGDRAAVLTNRFGSVRQQVHDDLTELRDVALDSGDVVGE